MSALLEVEGLTKHFPVRRGLLGRSTGLVRAVDSISFTIEAGTTFGLVGESGCGKTTTSRLVLGLERPTAGAIRFQDENVLTLDRAGLRRYRRSIQAVFQDPYASLDPRMRVGSIVAEPLVINEPMDRTARGRRVLELLDLVGLPAGAASPCGGPGPPARRARPSCSRTSSRAASGSAWPSRERWPCPRASWCWTSRSPRSTSPSARRS